MHVSIMVFAFAPFLAGNSPTNKWLDDYTAGYRQAASLKKPLAVVVGRGPSGWNTLDPKGNLDTQSQRILRNNYICVYVDASQNQNRDLVQQLQVGAETGLVLSDRTGRFVALRHTGPLSGPQLETTLLRHAGLLQETVPTAPVAPAGYAFQPQPSYAQPGYSAPAYCRT